MVFHRISQSHMTKKNVSILLFVLLTISSASLLTAHTVTPCIFYKNSSSYGWISSPNYPRGYPPGTSCQWLIDLGLLNQVSLRVHHLHLLPGDELRVYDGLSTHDVLLTTFHYEQSVSTNAVDSVSNALQSGGSMGGAFRRPSRIVSSTGRMLLHLASNKAAETQIALPWLQYNIYGFNATYQIRGLCIPGAQRACISNPIHCYDVVSEACDGFWDCPEDGSDEWNCSHECQGERRYVCPTMSEEESVMLIGKRRWGVAKCYTLAQRCDGDPACPGMQDEKHCSSEECGLRQGTWQCRSSGECIYAMYRCDGVAGDCSDESDEWNCNFPIPMNHTAQMNNEEDNIGGDPFYEWRNAPAMSVVLAAVIGSLSTGLVLITTVAYIVRLKTQRLVIRNREIFCSFDSPLQRLVEAELRRRRPPPRYDEAMAATMSTTPTGDDSSSTLSPSTGLLFSVPRSGRSSSLFTSSRRRRLLQRARLYQQATASSSSSEGAAGGHMDLLETERQRAAHELLTALMTNLLLSPLSSPPVASTRVLPEETGEDLSDADDLTNISQVDQQGSSESSSEDGPLLSMMENGDHDGDRVEDVPMLLDVFNTAHPSPSSSVTMGNALFNRVEDDDVPLLQH